MKRPQLRLSSRIGTQLKWLAFCALERLTATPQQPSDDEQNNIAIPSLWVFVSTIGELNAIGPFLREMIVDHPQLQLVLLTDRNIYREAYHAQYPHAKVIEITANSGPARPLTRTFPPHLFIIAEIPCRPADAPCRLPFAYLYQAKRAGATIALVNGWLYGYQPSCRIDQIERSLLEKSYLQLIDVLCVQSQAVGQALQRSGANPGNIHVTGNIKFDALKGSIRPPAATRSPSLLHSIEKSGRAIVVAGCVTENEERDLVLDAFVALLAHRPDAFLVIAPRHPENNKVMHSLRAAASSRQLNYRTRSADGDQAISSALQLLILDTMGELQDFYGRASVTHVGRDHNVLEPLSFGKTVSVRPNWNPTYPSFPVFSLTRDAGLLGIASEPDDLCAIWLEASQAEPAFNPQIKTALAHLGGVSARCRQYIAAALPESKAQ